MPSAACAGMTSPRDSYAAVAFGSRNCCHCPCGSRTNCLHDDHFTCTPYMQQKDRATARISPPTTPGVAIVLIDTVLAF